MDGSLQSPFGVSMVVAVMFAAGISRAAVSFRRGVVVFLPVKALVLSAV